MLERLRPRLTYANVISTLCLFLVLGGGAFAAVTSFVQTNGTIRGCVSKSGQLAVLKQGKSSCRKGSTAISWSRGGPSGPAGGDLTGNYPAPTIKPDAVTGAKVDESTLDQVPSAARADSASKLGGLAPDAFFPSSNIAWIDRSLTQNAAGTNGAVVLDVQGVNLTMDCSYDSGADLQGVAFFASNSGSKPHATITWQITHGASAQQGETSVSSASNSQVFERTVGPAATETGAGTFIYRDDTQAITIPFRYSVSYADAKCDVSGTATRAN